MASQLPSLWKRNETLDDLFQSFYRDIDSMFEKVGASLPAEWRSGDAAPLMRQPRMNVSETDTALEITFDLPGVEEKDIDVALTGDMLTVKGEKKMEREEKNKNFHVIERSSGAFQRSLRLPFMAEPSKIEAKLQNGVLTLVLPKPPEVQKKTQKISIKAS